MKKKLVLLLATLMCVSLCACGGSETSSGNNTDTKTEENGGSLSQGEEKEVEITMDNWQEYFEEIYSNIFNFQGSYRKRALSCYPFVAQIIYIGISSFTMRGKSFQLTIAKSSHLASNK